MQEMAWLHTQARNWYAGVEGHDKTDDQMAGEVGVRVEDGFSVHESVSFQCI